MKRFNPIKEAAKAGLLPCNGISGKQLREQNPDLAAKWAAFIKANEKQLISAIAGRVCGK